MEGFSFSGMLAFVIKLLFVKLLISLFTYIRIKIFKTKDETLEKNEEENDNNTSSNSK